MNIFRAINWGRSYRCCLKVCLCIWESILFFVPWQGRTLIYQTQLTRTQTLGTYYRVVCSIEGRQKGGQTDRAACFVIKWPSVSLLVVLMGRHFVWSILVHLLHYLLFGTLECLLLSFDVTYLCIFCCVKNISRPESRVEETQVSVKGKFRSVRSISKPQLSQRWYVVLEGDTTRCFVYLELPPGSMKSLVTTRMKGRAWCLVRSRVIATSRFWELPFLGERENCLRESFFVTTQFSFL